MAPASVDFSLLPPPPNLSAAGLTSSAGYKSFIMPLSSFQEFHFLLAGCTSPKLVPYKLFLFFSFPSTSSLPAGHTNMCALEKSINASLFTLSNILLHPELT